MKWSCWQHPGPPGKEDLPTLFKEIKIGQTLALGQFSHFTIWKVFQVVCRKVELAQISQIR